MSYTLHYSWCKLLNVHVGLTQKTCCNTVLYGPLPVHVYHKVGLQHFTLNIKCNSVSLFHSSSSLVLLLEGNITCLPQFLTDDDCSNWLLSLSCSTASTKSVGRLSLKLSTSPLSRSDQVKNWCRKVQCLEGSVTSICEVF